MVFISFFSLQSKTAGWEKPKAPQRAPICGFSNQQEVWLIERFDEALLGCSLFLAVSYSEGGREEDAQAETAAILKISPHFSVDAWGQSLPFKDQAELERHLAALRKAGLK